MFMIEDLWLGRFTPSERMIRKDSRYQKVIQQSEVHYDVFYNELSPAGKEAFENYYGTLMELENISEQDAFTLGVHFGIRLMLDVVGEYRSDLPMLGE